MSLRNVQRQAASRYADLGAELSSSLRPQQAKSRSGELTTTARLLRNSRLFSLPPPIPRPSSQSVTSLSGSNESDTATVAFPTRAAIVTPPGSLARGDWGLKRPLPSKAFKTTTPVIRLNANDTIDHITDFESAADHVFTLKKWQEMNIPITASQPGATSRYYERPPERSPSAFENHQDPKQIPEAYKSEQSSGRGWGVGTDGPAGNVPTRRWKYDSPWIAGMEAGTFEEYLHSAIKKRRIEFRDWLRTQLANERSADAAQAAAPRDLDQGIAAAEETAKNIDTAADDIIEELETAEADIKQAETPSTQDTVAADILDLRSRQRELFKYVWKFLDLPGKYPDPGDSLVGYTESLLDADQGPPLTHPSAGLSYLRPTPWYHNHPTMGPMAQAAPVQARVLQRAESGRSTVLGVGGVAAGLKDYNKADADYKLAALQRPGGAKTWVHPSGASIDGKGRIQLRIRKASEHDASIWGYANSSVETSSEDEQSAKFEPDRGFRKFGGSPFGRNGNGNGNTNGGGSNSTSIAKDSPIRRVSSASNTPLWNIGGGQQHGKLPDLTQLGRNNSKSDTQRQSTSWPARPMQSEKSSGDRNN